MPLDEFLSLNPQHNRPVIAGADEASILLPYDKAGLFAAKLELSDQPMVTWQAYRLKTGETLQQVATRFGLPLETLRAVNGIGPRAQVPVNHTLLVPSQLPSSATAATLQSAVFTIVPEGRTFLSPGPPRRNAVWHRRALSRQCAGAAKPGIRTSRESCMRGQRLARDRRCRAGGGKSKHGGRARKRRQCRDLGAGKPAATAAASRLAVSR